MARHRAQVRVYTRAGCGLCVAAERLVARELRRPSLRLRRGLSPSLEVVDVDSDEELARRYGVRVPVVTVDGVEIAELEVSRAQVRAALQGAAHRRS